MADFTYAGGKWRPVTGMQQANTGDTFSTSTPEPVITPVEDLTGIGREGPNTDIYGNKKVTGQQYLSGVYNPPAPTPTVTYTATERILGGFVVTYQYMSDGTKNEISRRQDKSAGDEVREVFRLAGLDAAFTDQLISAIDGVYAASIDPSNLQIMTAVYSSDAYKNRFKANEVIRKRLADGSGRAGDRVLSPKEYIDAEQTYATILSDRGMPTGYYDSPDDFTTLIGNSISPTEFQSRVNTAYDALNFADEYIVSSLENYYNLSKADLVAYLLDPAKAQPILDARQNKTNEFGLNDRTELQKMYETSQVGGMAARVGLAGEKDLSEDIVNLGKTAQAEAAFKTAADQAPDIERLGKLYGDPLDFKDLVKESLSLEGGATSGRKKKRFVGKEKAAFGKQSALGKSSLSKRQDV